MTAFMSVPRRPAVIRVAALVTALVAGGVLIAVAPARHQRDPAGRVAAATAWPRAQRADIPGHLPDGPGYLPGIFLDARTSVGTAATPDGRFTRLVLRRGDGTLRELRRLPVVDSPDFYNLTASGDELAWTESTDGQGLRIWAANLRGESPARLVTAQTGDAVFYGSQYDLVIRDNRVYWLAGAPADPGAGPATQVRSAPLTGGAVEVRRHPGTWSLSAWPWLVTATDDLTGATVLRNLETNRTVEVETGGNELTTCSPAWCRIMVMSGDGLERIDEMRPDGTARRRIAGGSARAALTDVAILDRFEILAEPEPTSELAGTERLVVHDLADRRTVDVSGNVTGTASRGGVLWWSTGDQDTTVWHTIDLRTA